MPAQQLTQTRPGPGNQHLFADASLSSYDEEATALLTKRVLDFLSVR